LSRIAIIDTAIDAKYIGGKAVDYYDLCESTGDNDNNSISHGTVCAMVLDHCAPDFELLNLRIFQDNGRKVFGDIELLAKALTLCHQMEADIVSLSAVSPILSDSKHLYNITLELSKNAIIVSALDNARFISVPTSYPHVLGVRNDILGRLPPGGLAYRTNDPYNANLFANCDFEFLRKLNFSPSNSFAVPVAAAYVNSLLNQGHLKHRILSMIRELEPYPNIDEFEEPRREASRYSEIPVVLLSGHSNEMCCVIMDSLFNNYEVQSAALSFERGAYDVRVREVSDARDIQSELNFLKYHYKTDIIFIVGNHQLLESIKQKVDIDVELQYGDDEQMMILYDDKCENELTVNIPERLHDILTS
jgi:hypothetical protein